MGDNSVNAIPFVGKSEESFTDVESYYSDRVKSSGIIKISEVKELKRMKGKLYVISSGGIEINEQDFIEVVKRAFYLIMQKEKSLKANILHGLFRPMLLELIYGIPLSIKGSDYRKRPALLSGKRPLFPTSSMSSSKLIVFSTLFSTTTSPSTSTSQTSLPFAQ